MNDKDIYNALSEIKERTASLESKIDTLVDSNKKIDAIKKMSLETQSETKYAHIRIDKIDKWLFAIGSGVVMLIIGALLNLVMN